ncbi:MAG: thiamine pyrophosphate-binding protein [Gammaproteobacteria bacterium]|nr:thiamine pyrophosphate-binding protein [Gammaproteobacteria bacterium]
MYKPKRSGGRILVDSLLAGGVERVFCVPGESYLPVLDALRDERARIDTIVCRQEGGAAYMADADAKLSGRPGVCFVSRGPGAANAMLGVHTAYQDSTPLLLFIGQIPRAERGREAFQELDYTRVYAGVAKHVIRVDRAADMPGAVCAAWAIATAGRPGPVVVELPEDVLSEESMVEDFPVGALSPAGAPRSPKADLINRFAGMLRAAKRPLVIAGGAAWTPEANRLLSEFADKHATPVACAFRRQDMVDNSRAHFVGELGIRPNPMLFELAQDADLVIALAARLGEITTCGYTLFDVPDFDATGARQLVHVFPGDKKELNSVFRAALFIQRDAETFLRAAQSIDAPAAAARAARIKRIQRARKSYVAFMNQPRHTGEAVRLDRVMEFLRARLPPDSIIATGAGNYTIWAQRNYQFRRPRTQLACTNGSMGYGVPAAVAGKLARPESIVVSFSGDGCFLMNGQELATAVRHNLSIVFIVINNRSYGTIRMHQERRYPGRPFATELVNPDFVALAKSYGAFGARVTRTEDFAPAFEQALAAGRPALIELPVQDSGADYSSDSS